MLCCIMLLLLLSVGSALTADDRPPMKLRVLTYNIHHGEGNDGKVDLPRIAQVITAAQPDLVALQEVDNGVIRSGRIDQPAELARLTGMKSLFGKAIPYNGGDYGQAILSKHPIEHVAIHALPGEPDQEKRIAYAVRVMVAEQKLLFVTTHLHHNNASVREKQAETLNQVFSTVTDPVILLGDLNANPDSRVLEILKPHWRNTTDGQLDQLTFPAPRPEKQIDYVLARPADRWEVVDTRVIDEPLASDHRPLVVELSGKVQ